MTWAKLDDTFIDDPDLLALPRGVRLLYVESIVWCCKHLTDGQLRTHVLGRITDEPDLDVAIKQLVEAGFWEPTLDGFEIVDFLEDQPSKEQVEQRQADTRARQERSRRHKAGDHSTCLRGRYCPQGAVTRDNTRESHSESRRESRRPDPTRPDPTVREGKGEVGRGASPLAPWGSLGAAPLRQGKSTTVITMPGKPCRNHGRSACAICDSP